MEKIDYTILQKDPPTQKKTQYNVTWYDATQLIPTDYNGDGTYTQDVLLSDGDNITIGYWNHYYEPLKPTEHDYYEEGEWIIHDAHIASESDSVKFWAYLPKLPPK